MFSCKRRWAFQPIWNRLWQFCSIRSGVLPCTSTKTAPRDLIISDVERGIPLQSRTHCRIIQMEVAVMLTQIFIRTSGSNYSRLFHETNTSIMDRSCNTLKWKKKVSQISNNNYLLLIRCRHNKQNANYWYAQERETTHDTSNHKHTSHEK